MIRTVLLSLIALMAISTPDLLAQAPEADAAAVKSAEVVPMSKDAQALFSLAVFGRRHIVASAFAPDGKRIALITEDSATGKTRNSAEECVGWTYDLNSQRLSRIAGSPLPTSCQFNEDIAWVGEDIYVRFVDYNTQPFKEQTMCWHDAKAAVIKPEDFPDTFRKALARKAASKKADSDLQNALNDDYAEVTADGRFLFLTGEGEGLQCLSLIASPKNQDWKKVLSTCSYPNGYILDRDADTVFIVRPFPVFNGHFATFAAFDFKSQGQRELNVPDIAPAPTLLAEKVLADGSARIAYAVQGKCDASDVDYFNDPESVCFIYFPPK